jgi:hypothetical protein
MPAAGRGRELSNDQMAAMAVAVVAVTIVWAERRLIAAAIGRWLQQPHHVDARAGRLHDPRSWEASICPGCWWPSPSPA